MSTSLWVAAGLAVVAGVIAITQLPRHTTHSTIETSVVEHRRHQHRSTSHEVAAAPQVSAS